MAALALNAFSGLGHDDPDRRFNYARELKEFFERRQRELGFSDQELAANFAVCSRGCALRALARFHRDGKIKDTFRVRLQQLLCLSDLAMGQFSRNFFTRAFAARDFFFENFAFFLEHADEIISTRAYANVTFFGMQVRLPWFNRTRPLTLGELLGYYRRGLWTVRCADGSRAYVYRVGGDGLFSLWGDAVDPVHHRVIRVSIANVREFAESFLRYEAPFEYQSSAWTVHSLRGHLHAA